MANGWDWVDESLAAVVTGPPQVEIYHAESATAPCVDFEAVNYNESVLVSQAQLDANPGSRQLVNNLLARRVSDRASGFPVEIEVEWSKNPRGDQWVALAIGTVVVPVERGEPWSKFGYATPSFP